MDKPSVIEISTYNQLSKYRQTISYKENNTIVPTSYLLAPTAPSWSSTPPLWLEQPAALQPSCPPLPPPPLPPPHLPPFRHLHHSPHPPLAWRWSCIKGSNIKWNLLTPSLLLPALILTTLEIVKFFISARNWISIWLKVFLTFFGCFATIFSTTLWRGYVEVPVLRKSRFDYWHVFIRQEYFNQIFRTLHNNISTIFLKDYSPIIITREQSLGKGALLQKSRWVLEPLNITFKVLQPRTDLWPPRKVGDGVVGEMGSPDPTETLSRLFARAPFLSPTFGNKLLESRKQIIRRGICQMLYMSNIPISFTFSRKKVRSSRQIENRGFYSSILSKLSVFVLKYKLTTVFFVKTTTTLAWTQ